MPTKKQANKHKLFTVRETVALKKVAYLEQRIQDLESKMAKVLQLIEPQSLRQIEYNPRPIYPANDCPVNKPYRGRVPVRENR
jgi:hypothetical protein